ncbi:MAG: AAA family ATPase [Deltaproteobacteria bacterium]|jgi:hypothetical protein|nr:AAA family ATPase [Deltaproteobacteria bacterium]
METAEEHMQKIGTNIVNFSELRNEGYVYVDKTEFVHELLSGPDKRLFLSRPRRFGKTLLIDTIEEAAVGRKELFAGLAIDRLRKADEWPRSHVLRIGMSRFGDDPALLDRTLASYMHSFASRRGFTITAQDSANSLAEVIETLSWNYADIPIITNNIRTKDVVIANRSKIIVLIDEYDAPIINNITNQYKLDIAKQTLHGFYNALKSCDSMIERVFITGITKFSQLSVFSAMNNLSDITFQPEYATICGFSLEEIQQYYCHHLNIALSDFQKHKEFGSAFTLKMLMERIEDWYDGYSWNGMERVINPLSLQNLLRYRKFDNFWIRSGGMNFLNQMNIKNDIFNKVFDGNVKFSGSLDIQDVGDVDPLALMLQTGYLTLRRRQEYDEYSKLYLTVPNREVGMTIMKNYVDNYIMPLVSSEKDIFNSVSSREFCNAFCQGKMDRAAELLQGFLSVIPYSLHEKMESLYHVILMSIFEMSDIEVDPEHNIAGGIIDLVVTTPDNSILVTEIKYAKSDDIDTADLPSASVISDKDEKKLDSCVKAAFRQILENKYLLPYVGSRTPVRAVAVAVCGRTRVRIRSVPAEELIRRAQEFLRDASCGEAGVVPVARGDETPQNPRPPRQRCPRR